MQATVQIVQLHVRKNDEWQLEQIDLIYRAIKNPMISHAYFRLYCALIDRWPQFLTGDLITDFSPVELRKEYAANISPSTVTKFLADLKECGIILEYYAGDPAFRNGETVMINTRLKGNPLLAPFPEDFKLSETDQRKKERDAQRNRAAQRVLILNCEVCTSPDIKYDLLPTCKKCGHKHQAIINIPVDQITIGEQKHDSFVDDLPDLDTPAPVQRNTEPIKPVTFTDVPLKQKYAHGCHNHASHKDRWKQTLSGLHCPICEPVWA